MSHHFRVSGDGWTYDHVTIVVDCRLTENEAGDVRRDLLPAVVLHDSSLAVGALRLRVVRRAFLGQEQLSMRNTCRPDLERLPHELVLRVDLAVVPPHRGLCPARRDGRVVAHLLGDVAVLLVVPDVLKRLALKTGDANQQLGKVQEERMRNVRAWG